VLAKVKELGDQGISISYEELVGIVRSVIGNNYDKHKDLKIPSEISVR